MSFTLESYFNAVDLRFADNVAAGIDAGDMRESMKDLGLMLQEGVKNKADLINDEVPAEQLTSVYRTLPINVRNSPYSAMGNGVADDTAAFQAALNDAAARGIMNVYVPKGRYVITDTVTIPAGVTLSGQSKLPFKANFGLDFACIVVKSTVIENDVFVYNTACGIKGLCFYWPDQQKTDSNPKPYGWAITSTGQPSGTDNVVIEDIMLTNCYRGVNIDFGGQWNCRNVFGQAFDIGIRIDRMYDVSQLNRVHFWDFWAGGSDAAKAYVQNNGRAVVIGRADDLKMSDIFAWGHKHTLHYTDLGSGSSWSHATNVTGDNCLVPILIEKVNIAQLVNVIAITNAKLTGRSGIETSADIGGGEVQITNYSTYQCHTGINISSATGTFRFVNLSPRRRGLDNSDIFGYAIINQSTAKVYVDTVEYTDVSGFVQVGANVNWSSDTDVTFANFSTPHSWLDATSARIAAISGGSRFTLNGGISTCRIDLPQSIKDNAGVYVLECDLQLNTPANLGPGQFYLRLTDTNVNDVILPGSVFNGFFVQKTHLRIPFIVRGNLTLQFVFGNASAACTMDITNLKIFQMAAHKQTRTTVDWVHRKQPNSLSQLLPTVLK